VSRSSQALLVEKLRFQPVETPDGKRYEVTGRLAVGGLLAASQPTDSVVVASPGGVELYFGCAGNVNRDACLTSKRPQSQINPKSLWCRRAPVPPRTVAARQL
jgi:hypothetical protein